MDPTMTKMAQATCVDEAAGRRSTPFLPVVHCFEYDGTFYAYFVRTGDLVALSRPAYEALAQIAGGLSLSQLRQSLSADIAARSTVPVLHDLDQLEQAGLFEAELTLTAAQTDADIEGLLRHHPRNIMFLVTEACNLACTYCYELNQGVHAKPLTMKQVDARKILDTYLAEAAGREDVCVTFFGGEPLLNFALIRDTVLYAEEQAKLRNVRISFTTTTNATLVTPEIAAFLAEHRFHVMVSLDGSKEANDRHRVFHDGSGTHDVVVRNLRVLIEAMRHAGVRLPKIRATATAGNEDPLAIDKYLRSLGTPFVEVGESHGTASGGRKAYDVEYTGNPSDASQAPFAREQQRILAALASNPNQVPHIPAPLLKSLRKIHDEASRQEIRQVPAPTLCGVCRNMKAVTPGGDLYPCHRYVGMPAFKLGNIHEGGPDKARVERYYHAIYSAYEEKCTKCWARYLCGGQCPWYLSNDQGTVGPPDDATCDSIRGGLTAALGFYATLLAKYPVAFKAYLATEPTALIGTQLHCAPDQSCST
jgi:uncharacterized protein